MTIDNFHFYLQNRQIISGQTGGQRYSDTSPFSVPWYRLQVLSENNRLVAEQLPQNMQLMGGRKFYFCSFFLI
jgi:hypothetical protein